jgi:hypothetical protein
MQRVSAAAVLLALLWIPLPMLDTPRCCRTTACPMHMIAASHCRIAACTPDTIILHRDAATIVRVSQPAPLVTTRTFTTHEAHPTGIAPRLPDHPPRLTSSPAVS